MSHKLSNQLPLEYIISSSLVWAELVTCSSQQNIAKVEGCHSLDQIMIYGKECLFSPRPKDRSILQDTSKLAGKSLFALTLSQCFSGTPYLFNEELSVFLQSTGFDWWTDQEDKSTVPSFIPFFGKEFLLDEFSPGWIWVRMSVTAEGLSTWSAIEKVQILNKMIPTNTGTHSKIKRQPLQ